MDLLQDYPQFTKQPIERLETKQQIRKKKIIVVIEFVLIILMLQAALSLFQGHTSEEPLRFRILAHSDAPADQAIKTQIQQAIEPMIANVIAASSTDHEIQSGLQKLEADMLAVAKQYATTHAVTLEQKEALFPTKRSSIGIHPQDVYDAYVLTIGSGRGDNWWCSIFPKVCYEEESEEEVKFFIWEWITSLFA